MATVVKNMIHFLRGVGWLSEDFWQRWSPMCLFPRPGGMLVVSVLPGLVDEYITENTYYYHSFPLLPFSSFSTTSAIMFPEPWVGRWYKGLLLDNSISLFNVITPQSFLKVLAPNWLNCTFICLLLFWTTQKCFMLDPNCWVSYFIWKGIMFSILTVQLHHCPRSFSLNIFHRPLTPAPFQIHSLLFFIFFLRLCMEINL